MTTPMKFSRFYTLGLMALFAPLAAVAADDPAPIPYFWMTPADVTALNAAFKKAIISGNRSPIAYQCHLF